jgi:hypothetical protein
MAKKHKDLSGSIFGRLTVIERAADRVSGNRNRTFYLCRCVCGDEVEVFATNLMNGNNLSCGCLRKEVTEFKKLNANPNRMVSGKVTTEYVIWQGMQQRCHNPKDRGYPKYGAKGVSVCERWRASFDNFLEDMGKRPSLFHSLDRFPNRKGNYEKSNCRWGTDMEQACNREGIVWIEYKGLNMVKLHWAKYFGVSQNAFDWHYMKKKKTMEQIEAHYNKKKENK